MHPGTIRRLVLATCVAGIAGMIVTQIGERNDATVAFGLLTSAAVLVLLAVTSVTTRRSGPPRVDESEAEALESRVRALVAEGVDERDVRAIVHAAIRLGRRSA